MKLKQNGPVCGPRMKVIDTGETGLEEKAEKNGEVWVKMHRG